MIIGIDASTLAIPFYCGDKNYSQNLIYALAKIDKKNKYLLFSHKTVNIPKQKNFKLIKTTNVFPILKRQFSLSYYIKKEKVDVLHRLTPYGDIFLDHPCIVTTVQDVDLGMTYPLLGKFFLNRIVCEVTRRATFNRTKFFVVPTASIKNELREYVKHSNIFSISHGVGPEYQNILKRVKPSKHKYFLCLGDFTDRKNTKRVLLAYSLLPKNIRHKYHLVVVTSTSKPAIKLRKISENLKIEPTTKVVSNVSKDRLIRFYRGSSGFVYPSLYEGFGLPILEAMAGGVPVITSKFGATHDTASGAALLVDPTSEIQIKDALLKLINDKRIINSLIEKGFVVAKQRTWIKTATETLKVYKKIFNEKK